MGKSYGCVWEAWLAFYFVTIATGFPLAAIAEPTSSTQPSSDESISETFERAFENDPNFFRKFWTSTWPHLGLPSFRGNSSLKMKSPEMPRWLTVYQNTLEQQVLIQLFALRIYLESLRNIDSVLSPVSMSAVWRETLFEALPPQ